ncbi:alpha/beta hydrolase [Tistrella sp. BH-R2-4]|uniref:Alpha/beta hydrolase n=1 Tax=Tistrella arctica TaxID=3133430 RepID=A0ABU9YLR6_9PROT
MADVIDADLKAMLDAAAAATAAPSIRDLPVAEARAAYRERYLMRGIRAPDAAVTMDELVIGLPGRDIAARLYRPAVTTTTTAAVDAPLPLLIYFHGGGFVVGDAAAYDAQSRYLAVATGALVLTPDYRLAPEHPFPAAVDDACDIFDHVAATAAALGADPARIAVGGDSAGGCLALVVSLTTRDAARSRPAAPRPSLCLSLYPVTDFSSYRGGTGYPSMAAFGKGFFLDADTMDWFIEHYLPQADDAGDPRASPILWPDLTDLPPTILVTAGHDPLRDMGNAFALRMMAAGCVVDHVRLPSMIHNFPGYAGLSTGAARAFADVAARLAARI